ncbi:MAG TPA: DUF6157 family protein [Planctomycetaceae bacterium]
MSYADTFILVAPDCPVTSAVVPVAKGERIPVHVLQYDLLTAEPYRYTHEDLVFETFVRREGITAADARARSAEIRAELFRKPHACLRASALPKRYGWGVHYDGDGRIALYAMESDEYRRFATDAGVKRLSAMRNKRG